MKIPFHVRMLLIAAAASILSPVIQATRHIPFMLEVRRYTSRSCNSSHRIPSRLFHLEREHLKEGKCHSWVDNKPFQALDYAWMSQTSWGEDKDQCYGNCELDFWSEKRCGGVIIGNLTGIKADKTFSGCGKGWYGPGKSVEFKCDWNKEHIDCSGES